MHVTHWLLTSTDMLTPLCECVKCYCITWLAFSWSLFSVRIYITCWSVSPRCISVLKLSCALQELATCHHDWNSFGDHMLPADQHLLSDGHVQRNFAPVTCCGSCEYLADCLNCAHLSALGVWTQEEGQGGGWGHLVGKYLYYLFLDL